MSRVRNITTVLSLIGLSACSLVISLEPGKLPGATCADADECIGERATCDQSQCVLGCAIAADCPETTACVDDLCRAAGAVEFGGACSSAADCATALCDQGLCVSACVSEMDCPNGSVCAGQICQPTLRAGFIFDAVVSNASFGFAHTHDEGRDAAEDALPWLETVSSEGNNATNVNDGIESLLGDDVDIIFVTSGLFATQAMAKAATNPETKFFTYASATTANHTGYAARFHQAWYVAGIVAGTFDTAVTQRNTIGFIAPLAIPQVIRELNAFALGVQSVAPSTKVEVIWANTFAPSTPVTEALVDYLVTGGNHIIVNRLGTRGVNDYVDTLPDSPAKIYSIAVNDLDGCGPTPTSCLGAPYWNWSVLYERLIRDVRRGAFDPSVAINDSMRPDPAESTFHFALNNARITQLDSIATQVANAVDQVVGPNGEDTSLAGPYCVTRADQRTPECVGDGEIIEDNELASMCWLVDGIVQRADPEIPTSTVVDAFAPDGTVTWPPVSVDPQSIARPSCR